MKDCFLKIPYEILKRKDISMNEKAVLSYVSGFTEKGQNCFTSNDKISEILGINVKTVKTIIKSLEDKGLIHRKRLKMKQRILSTKPIGTDTVQTPTQAKSHKTVIASKPLDDRVMDILQEIKSETNAASIKSTRTYAGDIIKALEIKTEQSDNDIKDTILQGLNLSP